MVRTKSCHVQSSSFRYRVSHWQTSIVRFWSLSPHGQWHRQFWKKQRVKPLETSTWIKFQTTILFYRWESISEAVQSKYKEVSISVIEVKPVAQAAPDSLSLNDTIPNESAQSGEDRKNYWIVTIAVVGAFLLLLCVTIAILIIAKTLRWALFFTACIIFSCIILLTFPLTKSTSGFLSTFLGQVRSA